MSTGFEQQVFQGENHGHASSQAFEVHLPGPLDIPASLELFRSNGDDLIDRWDGATLIRTLPVGTQSVAYACTVRGTREEPSLQVVLEDARWKSQVEQAILTMFVHPPASFVRLLQTDVVIAHLEKTYPGLRPVLQFDLFAARVFKSHHSPLTLKRREKRGQLAPRQGAGRPLLTCPPDRVSRFWRLLNRPVVRRYTTSGTASLLLLRLGKSPQE